MSKITDLNQNLTDKSEKTNLVDETIFTVEPLKLKAKSVLQILKQFKGYILEHAVKGDTGAQGLSIIAVSLTLTSTESTGNTYKMTCTLSDMSTINAGTFFVPKGDKGDTGDTGATGNGIASITKTGSAGLVDTYRISFTDGTYFDYSVTNGAKGDKGEPGVDGQDGAAATISVGTTTTGAPGTNASVQNVGTPNAAVFNFTIPRGEKGDKGDQGEPGTGAGNSNVYFNNVLQNDVYFDSDPQAQINEKASKNILGFPIIPTPSSTTLTDNEKNAIKAGAIVKGNINGLGQFQNYVFFPTGDLYSGYYMGFLVVSRNGYSRLYQYAINDSTNLLSFYGQKYIDIDSASNITIRGISNLNDGTNNITIAEMVATKNKAAGHDTDILNLQNADTTLQNNIDAEALARAGADSGLQQQITANANAIAGKLDKVSTTTTNSQAYIKVSDGSQAMADLVAGLATPNTIPYRDSNGRLQGANPSASNDLVPKGYGDAAYAAKTLSNVTYPANTAGSTTTGSGDRVIETYISSDKNTWYRKWASGWKECGGYVAGGNGFRNLTLPITFSSTNYSANVTVLVPNENNHTISYKIRQRNTNSIRLAATYCYGNEKGYAVEPGIYYACGY